MSSSDKIDKSGGHVINSHKLAPGQHMTSGGVITTSTPFSITGGNSLARIRQPWPIPSESLTNDVFWFTNATLGGAGGNISGILTGADDQANMVISPTDYRVTVKSNPPATGQQQAQQIQNAWGVGPTVEWGKVGTCLTSTTGQIWLWTSPSTATRVDTIAGFGLLVGGRYGSIFSGYHGNKALFYSYHGTVGTPSLFQWFDVVDMSWGSVISGPNNFKAYDGYSYYQRMYDPTDDSIWFAGYGNGVQGNGTYPVKIASNGTVTVFPTKVTDTYYSDCKMAVLEGRFFACSSATAAGPWMTNIREYDFNTNLWINRGQVYVDAYPPWGYDGGMILFDDFTLAYHAPQPKRIGLLDLNADPVTSVTQGGTAAYLGLVQTNYGGQDINMGYAALFGSGPHNFFVGYSNALWRVRYDPALYVSNGANWSLVGARINGFGTYTDPSDERLSSGAQNYCFNTYNSGWGPANK